MMKKIAGWIIISIFLFVSLVACGKEETQVNEAPLAMDYQVEWIPLEEVPNTSIAIPVLTEQTIYYVSEELLDNEEIYILNRRDIVSGEVQSEPLRLADVFNMAAFVVDEAGNRYFCINDNTEREQGIAERARKVLIKQDSSGNEIFRQEISEDYTGKVVFMDVDKQNYICFSNNSMIHRFDSNGQFINSEEKELSMDSPKTYMEWANYGIVGDTVAEVFEFVDGRIGAVIRNGEKKCYEVAILIPKDVEGVSERTELVLGVLTSNSILEEAVADFNKQQRDVRVIVKEYQEAGSARTTDEAITVLAGDIMTGKGPDILAIAPGVNGQILFSSGVLENLQPYVEKSSIINQEEYLTAAWNFCKDGENLFAVPTEFTLMTLVGKSEVVGVEPGLSVEDLMGLAQAYPESSLLERTSNMTVFSTCISFRADTFIDWETNTCNFHTDAFYEMLNFADAFPNESEAVTSREVDRYRSGKVLLKEVQLYSVDSYMQIFEDFGTREITFSGYPTTNDVPGNMISQCNEIYGISSTSEHKEEAWEYIEAFVLWNGERKKTVGYPTNILELKESLTNELADKEELDDAFKEELVNKFVEMAKKAAGDSSWEAAVARIVLEEVEGYFAGNKSAEEAAQIIQNRVQLYLDEK